MEIVHWNKTVPGGCFLCEWLDLHLCGCHDRRHFHIGLSELACALCLAYGCLFRSLSAWHVPTALQVAVAHRPAPSRLAGAVRLLHRISGLSSHLRRLQESASKDSPDSRPYSWGSCHWPLALGSLSHTFVSYMHTAVRLPTAATGTADMGQTASPPVDSIEV